MHYAFSFLCNPQGHRAHKNRKVQWVSSIPQFFFGGINQTILGPISTIGRRKFYSRMRRNKDCALPIAGYDLIHDFA